MVSASLCWRQSCPVVSLIDSGAENNFVDREVVKQLGIPTEPLEGPLEARSLNGLALFKVHHHLRKSQ